MSLFLDAKPVDGTFANRPSSDVDISLAAVEMARQAIEENIERAKSGCERGDYHVVASDAPGLHRCLQCGLIVHIPAEGEPE